MRSRPISPPRPRSRRRKAAAIVAPRLRSRAPPQLNLGFTSIVHRSMASRDWRSAQVGNLVSAGATSSDDGFNGRSDQGLLHRHRAGVPALRRA